MERINIAELLKDCPKGMELDCIMYDNVVFEKLDVSSSHHPIILRRRTDSIDKYSRTVHLTKYGQYSDDEDCKCVIFPKGKTTWEGFVPPCKFKDGDILFAKSDYDWIFIYKESGNDVDLYKYVSIPHNCFYKFITYDDNPICRKKEVSEIRLATEEEKKKLFDTIKENGYKWNANTNTLEKLPETKFKVGDRIKNKNVNLYHTVNSILGGSYIVDDNLVLDMKMEHLYELAPDIKPKFKIGDRVKKNKDYISGIVTDIFDDSFKVTYDGGGCSYVQFHYQDAWELVPDKFDITTLVPFESRVLVRDNIDEVWLPCFFGGICNNDNNYPYRIVGGERWKCCIPYKGNEHLLNKKEDCDEYFKTW